MRMKHLLEQHLQNRPAPVRGEDPEFDQQVDAGVAWFMNLSAEETAKDSAGGGAADNVVAFTAKQRPVHTFSLMAAGAADDNTPWFDHTITLPGFVLSVSPLAADESKALIQIEAVPGEEEQFDAMFGADLGELIPVSMYWNNELLLRGRLLVSDDKEERSATGKGTIYRRICSFSEQFSIRFDPLD